MEEKLPNEKKWISSLYVKNEIGWTFELQWRKIFSKKPKEEIEDLTKYFLQIVETRRRELLPSKDSQPKITEVTDKNGRWSYLLVILIERYKEKLKMQKQ